jgi:hypothetical protein
MVASEQLAVHLDKELFGKFAHFVNDASSRSGLSKNSRSISG